jgi:hypothetical protein
MLHIAKGSLPSQEELCASELEIAYKSTSPCEKSAESYLESTYVVVCCVFCTIKKLLERFLFIDQHKA